MPQIQSDSSHGKTAPLACWQQRVATLLLLVAAVALSACSGPTERVKSVRGLRSGVTQGTNSGEGNAVADTGKLSESCGQDYKPGRVSLQLLSTAEYDQTIADLLYTDQRPSKLGIFEVAPKGPTGFASDTGYAVLSPLTVAKYYDAASQMANWVIATKGGNGSAYTKLASCAVGKTKVDDACVDSIVKSMGLRAWRRPLSALGADSELARLRGLISAAGSFDEGLHALIRALLISPNFLFVSITSDQSAENDAIFKLDQFQMASRLSYFLWGTMPDDQLFALAADGKLDDDKELIAQVDRMIHDDRAKHVVRAIVQDWIGIDVLDTMVTPSLSADLKRAMIEETWRLVADLVIHDKSLINLTAAKYSYMNKALAEHYGLPFDASSPTEFKLVDLGSSPRVGVLSHASFLLATAGATTETRPVKRGKSLALNWLCHDVPPPPPGVPPLDPSVLPANATPRQVLEVHTKSPSCAACHQILDPLGLGFESFDSFGKWRDHYDHLGGAPIDSSGTLDYGPEFSGTRELLAHLSESPEVKSCMARKVMEMAVKRLIKSKDDRCIAQSIGSSHLKHDSKLSDLLKAVVVSRQFRMQTGESQ